MIKVKFFTLLRLALGLEEVSIEAKRIDVKSLLIEVCKKIGNEIILKKLLDEHGNMQTGTIILINGHDIFHMDKLDTIIESNDSVSLFTPGGGG